MTLSEPGLSGSTSQFQAEPVEGRRVSKVVKTTVVRGERVEKHLGDSSLATDLPSAKDDFEKVQNHLRFAVCVYLMFVFCLKREQLSVCRLCVHGRARLNARWQIPVRIALAVE